MGREITVRVWRASGAMELPFESFDARRGQQDQNMVGCQGEHGVAAIARLILKHVCGTTVG
jgi:hypothetical protein